MAKRKADRRVVNKWLRTLPPDKREEAERLLRKSPSRKVRKLAPNNAVSLGQARREACAEPRMRPGVPHKEPGMRRARGKVKFGDAKLGTRRFTPADAIAGEDRYDLMSAERAAACGDPPSITGRQMEYLRERNLRVESTRKKSKQERRDKRSVHK